VGKLEVKRPLERPRGWWVDNIKIDVREAGWGDVVWTGLVLLRMEKCRGLL
jgi:hypothetical protein